MASIFAHGDMTLFISFMRTLIFNLATIIAIPVLFFHLFGSSYESAYYGVWYSIVGSELLATVMTFIFLNVCQTDF